MHLKTDKRDPRGRKAMCTHEMIKNLCDELRVGAPIKLACSLCGISVRAFYLWRKNGEIAEENEDYDSIYFKFFRDTSYAIACYFKERITDIRDSSADKFDEDGKLVKRGEWTANAWVLERRDPESFGRNTARVNFQILKGVRTIESLNELSAEITAAFVSGDITIEQADAATRVVESRRKFIEITDLSDRISALENKLV